MTRTVLRAGAALFLLSLSAGASLAGPIQNACLASDRGAGQRGLCACIQQAADISLRSGDQRRAAKFFADPDKAQEVLVSKRASDDAFWERYRAFTETAEALCAQ